MNRIYLAAEDGPVSIFAEMQRIVERRQTPVMEAYLDDFYDLDRSNLGRLYAPGGNYLWLQHPCGSHFGMIGVFPATDTYINSVLEVYGHSYSPERMELHHIAVGADGDTIINKITNEKGRQLVRELGSAFRMDGALLYKRSEVIAEINVRVENNFQSSMRGYYARIESDHPLSRLDAYAAVMYAERAGNKRAGTFLPSLERLYNGRPFDEVYPVAVIPPVERGLFSLAPLANERARV